MAPEKFQISSCSFTRLLMVLILQKIGRAKIFWQGPPVSIKQYIMVINPTKSDLKYLRKYRYSLFSGSTTSLPCSQYPLCSLRKDPMMVMKRLVMRQVSRQDLSLKLQNMKREKVKIIHMIFATSIHATSWISLDMGFQGSSFLIHFNTDFFRALLKALLENNKFK